MRVSPRVRGLAPSSLLSARIVRVCAFGLVGVGFAGCATQPSQPQYAGAYSRVAERTWKPEIEEDGRPAQAPPVRAMRPEEDDPTQPWSPNYGKPPSAWRRPQSPVPAEAAQAPLVETSVQQRVATATPSRRLSAAEADQVVLRAIQNHETQRP